MPFGSRNMTSSRKPSRVIATIASLALFVSGAVLLLSATTTSHNDRVQIQNDPPLAKSNDAHQLQFDPHAAVEDSNMVKAIASESDAVDTASQNSANNNDESESLLKQTSSPIRCGSKVEGSTSGLPNLYGGSGSDALFGFYNYHDQREYTFQGCDNTYALRLIRRVNLGVEVASTAGMPALFGDCDGGISSQIVRLTVRLPVGLYYLVVDSISSSSYSVTMSCGPLSSVTSNQVFYIYEVPLTQAAASQACEAVGTTLAHVTTAEEATAVSGLISLNAVADAWIGANDVAAEGKFVLSPSWPQPIVFTNWMTGEPNNANAVENCVVTKPGGQWSDVACGEAHSYVCSAFLRKRSTDSQVFAHISQPSTYAAAQQVCQTYGMRLAHITSAAEMTTVTSMISTLGSAWIGVNDITLEGRFDLARFNAPVVYTNWLTGQPSNGVDEDCVMARTDGKWDDVTCASTLAFVCSGYHSIITRTSSVHVYVQFANVVTNAAAQQICVANGMELARVTSAAEASLVGSLLASTAGGTVAWIGIADSVTEGTYELGRSKARARYFNWAVGRPSDPTGTNDCVQAWVDGRWTDVSCGLSSRLVCSGYLDTVSSISQTQRFVVLPTAVTWGNAQTACDTIGMTLAHAVPSAQPAIGAVLSRLGTTGWVGVSDFRQELSFTYELTRLPIVAGTLWQTNPVRNTVQNCVETLGNGRFVARDCATLLRPVCSAFMNEIRSGGSYSLIPISAATCESVALKFFPPISAAENTAIATLMTMAAGRVVLGLSDRASEGTFLPECCSTFSTSYRNWATGEPNNVNNEDCVEMRSGGLWNDAACTTAFAFRACKT